jgi:hypothetical protein
VLVNIFDEDVPHSVTRLLGHACGVIAAAMAVISGYGVALLVRAAIGHRAAWFGAIAVLIGIALTGLLFRWAGVLTGHFKPKGRLSVSPSVYVGIGVACSALALGDMYLLLASRAAEPIRWIVGAICGAALAHWCYLLLRNQRK